MTQPKQRRTLYAATVSAALSAAVLAAVALSCGGQSKVKADLAVTSFAPIERSVGSEPIQLTFDQPVVADDRVGQSLTTPPVKIEPPIQASSHWLDRQTLVIAPSGEMKQSTRYEISLIGEIGKRTGGFSFSFIHEPLVIEGVWGVAIDQLPASPTLPIHFNQSVLASSVIRHCRIAVGGGGESIRLLSAVEGIESGAEIAVKPASALAQDSDYELVCAKITGAGGNVPIDKPYVLPLHTHAKFAVKRSSPSGWDVPADDVEIEIVFATPVNVEQVRKSVRARPKIAGLDQGWLDSSGTRYKAIANLKASTEYEVKVAGEVVDTFGQKLDKPFRFSFQTGNARPRLSMETGIYAVEAASSDYPVWTRNVRDFDVECAVVPANRIVKLLTSSLDYDPWYDAGSDQSLDWIELGLKKRSRRIEIDQPKNKWHLSRLALRDLCGGTEQRGLFLADIRSRDIEPDEDYPWRYRPHRRVLANVTDFGILLKAGTGSGLIWVSRISTGKPVSGANVAVYTPQGRLAYRGRTDKDGVLRLPGTTKLLRQPGAGDKEAFGEGYNEYSSYRSQRLIATVEKAGDLALVDGNWANGIQTWNFGVREDRRSGTTRIRGFIQSDRGIYRPGETVHFKGLVREIAVGKPPVVPRAARVKLRVEDSRGQSVMDKTMRLTEFGGFAFDLPLEQEANLGDYYVNATIKGQTFRERFSVEEFRKVSFEVDVKGNERHGRLGDKLSFKLDANYLFGAPVASANVEWNVYRRPHTVSFPEYAQYYFADYASRGWDYWYYESHGGDNSPSFVSDGIGVTDRRGRFRFSVRDPRRNFDGPQDYVIGVSVRDETDQTISKRSVVTAHKTDFYLGLHTQEYVQAMGMPFAVNIVAVTPSGQRVPAKATLRFIRETYSCEYSGGYRSHRTCKTRHEVEKEREIDVPATGTGTERIMPEKPGEYIVRVEAVDGRGNTVVSSGNVWILGRGEAFWSGDESARMSLIASKQAYKPGETARLVPRTGLTNTTALITIERNGILDAFVKPMAASSDGIEIELEDAHAPNVYASVAMITGRTGEGDRRRPRFKMGVVELKVSPEDKRLEVAVKSDKESYQPGELVSGTVRVTANAQPVRAEVSVSVADEGVLQLIAYKTPDPMKAFYASWGLGVDASANWNRIARLNDPTAGDPDMGGDSGGGPEDSVRSNFVSSAYWASSLVTDENGEVSFQFKAPDNLTAFRMMVVAADAGSQFGSSDRRFTVAKPLLAKPILPRFLRTGDRATVGVAVHNYTGTAGTATVTASGKGVRVRKKSRQVALAKDRSARVNFPINVGNGRTAKFAFAVEMDGHRDALEVEIPVQRSLIIDKKTVAAGVAGADGQETVEVPISWNDSLVKNRSMVTVTIDRTGLGELEPGLRYLIEYPYGCLEQTLSRFIPLTKVKDLARSLKNKDLQGPKLNAFIRAGVAKVARHQHADGHFSLWPSGKTYPHLTVYAIFGLTEARRAGIKVPDQTVELGIRALKTWVSKTRVSPGGESGTMAMAAYVLAESGQPDRALNTRLFEARAGLPRYGAAFLLRAMKRSRSSGTDIDTLKGELYASAESSDGFAFIRETGDLSHYMSSDVRSSAIALSALLELDGKSPMIDQLAEGLKKKQRPGGGWYNTQDNLYSLVALSDYARSESESSEVVTLYINDKKQVRRKIKGSKILVLRRRLHNYQPGSVKIETTGKVRYAVRLTEAREEKAVEAVNKGFAITREYLDPKSGTPVAEFKTGQLIKVRIAIESADSRRYVAVDDPLPAGFEAVNTKLASAQNTGSGEAKSSWGWSHRELRDDRALAFVDNMGKYQRKMQMEYLVRATTPGTFVVPPASVEEMYNPDVRGRSTTTTVVIKR
ncbi:MAG: MG2 domain-containing protein [Proteobacteria bacterium]|nr:MG2 domain-containing protein [Pseudomonadota bacterium]